MRVPNHCARTFFNGCCDILAAIGFFARICDKNIAALDRTAVGHQAHDGYLQGGQLLAGPFVKGGVHTSSLTISAGGATTLSNGASFGTFSACNDAPIILLKAGPATSPP